MYTGPTLVSIGHLDNDDMNQQLRTFEVKISECPSPQVQNLNLLGRMHSSLSQLRDC